MPITHRAVVGVPGVSFFVSWVVVGYFSAPSEIDSIISNIFAWVKLSDHKQPTQDWKGPLQMRYSWIADQVSAHEKSIWRKTRRVTTIPRPPLESSQQGEFRSAWYIFVWSNVYLLFLKTFENRVPAKIYQADLNSPRRILVCQGLRPFWGASDRWKIIFLRKSRWCVCAQ